MKTLNVLVTVGTLLGSGLCFAEGPARLTVVQKKGYADALPKKAEAPLDDSLGGYVKSSEEPAAALGRQVKGGQTPLAVTSR